jgi:Entner-Doudoroff aldolase
MGNTTEASQGTVARMRHQIVVPVLRCPDPDDAVETARAAARAGLSVIELTMSTPDVFAAVAELRSDGLIVGVGTIRDANDVERAAQAGAEFVVSFMHPLRFVETAREAGLVCVPGALTPSEIAAALTSRPDAVKIYPARHVGPSYLKDMRQLMGPFEAMVSGGIAPTAEALRPWLDAGVLGIGCGSALGTASRDGAETVEARCRAALNALRT